MPSRTSRRPGEWRRRRRLRRRRLLRLRLARALEQPPSWIFPLQGGAVLAVAFYMLLPFYLSGSPSAYGGAARVVECHRWPVSLWLYYRCSLAPPGDDRSPLGVYSDKAISTHRLHGIAEFEMHGMRVRAGVLSMLLVKGTPKLPQWTMVLSFPVLIGATLLVGAIEVRIANRIAGALRP